MTQRKPYIVGIGGTTRTGSSSEQALALALSYAREKGAETKMYGGNDLLLPMYDPDPGTMTDAGRRLIEDLRKADGIILCSPCYHGGVSGLVKNAIDYTEEMNKDARVYFDGRAIGSIGVGFGYQGPTAVLSQLRQIGHALRGWNVPLGVSINSAVVKFKDGQCSEPAIAGQIQIMAGQVVQQANKMMA
ncbi:MAG TPA: NAD(P)H-dependent oxidoreductase [Beijerinckiaceae bacterium]|jgi:FMN reductase|nr:NAD(P)H-dependent oxidoreductase [Beijerinckiaceae bacterium]